MNRHAQAVNGKQDVSGIPDGSGYQGLLFLSAHIVVPVKRRAEGDDHVVLGVCSEYSRKPTAHLP